MSLISCPECQQQVSDQAPACQQCGYPLHIQGNPYRSPNGVPSEAATSRRPYYHYGLTLAAIPMAVGGIIALLEQQGLQFSMEVLGIGTAVCVLPATGLLAYAALDRFVLHHGLPVAKARFDVRLLLVAIVIGAVLFGLAMVNA